MPLPMQNRFQSIFDMPSFYPSFLAPWILPMQKQFENTIYLCHCPRKKCPMIRSISNLLSKAFKHVVLAAHAFASAKQVSTCIPCLVCIFAFAFATLQFEWFKTMLTLLCEWENYPIKHSMPIPFLDPFKHVVFYSPCFQQCTATFTLHYMPRLLWFFRLLLKLGTH